MDCIVHGVAKSQTRLSDFDLTLLHARLRSECFIVPNLILTKTTRGQYCYPPGVNRGLRPNEVKLACPSGAVYQWRAEI